MSSPVDIVIPVFNGMPFIQQSVASCLAQSADELTVTVVDNVSTDGTWEWLNTAAAGDRRINLIRNSTNVGMMANIRKCLQSIRSGVFCFLCADDMLNSPHSIRTALDILKSNPPVGVVYSDMIYVDAGNRVISRRRAGRSGPFSSRKVGRECILEGRNLFGIPILTRSDLLAHEQFEESLNYAGDVDFAIRIGERCASWHHPDFLIANRYHEKNATRELHRLARAQFLTIARRNGYQLSRLEGARMSVSCLKNSILKTIFLHMATARNRISGSPPG